MYKARSFRRICSCHDAIEQLKHSHRRPRHHHCCKSHYSSYHKHHYHYGNKGTYGSHHKRPVPCRHPYDYNDYYDYHRPPHHHTGCQCYYCRKQNRPPHSSYWR